DFLDRFGPKNIKCTGFIQFNSSEFCQILNDSKYILQLSYYECFGCSVIDGAFAGCYPIVYSQFALSELIQDNGKYFPYGNYQELGIFIKKQIYNNLSSKSFVEKYFEFFTIEKRKEKILSTINE